MYQYQKTIDGLRGGECWEIGNQGGWSLPILGLGVVVLVVLVILIVVPVVAVGVQEAADIDQIEDDTQEDEGTQEGQGGGGAGGVEVQEPALGLVHVKVFSIG